ncbi:MAG TPA: ComEA family DNA-binding protein [Candidatus Polarisedimenticolia bacterium]|jgi:competence protein ComEA
MRSAFTARLLAAALAAAIVTAAGPTTATAAGADAKQEVAAVDINGATVEELMNVPGIGQVIAQRIVEFREKNGPYKAVDDLLKVQGIGERSLAKIRDRVSVGKGKR